MKIKNIFNFVGFQLNWLLCIFGAVKGIPWIGPVAVFFWALVHLNINKSQYREELLLILFAAFVGYTVDSMLVLFDYLSFPDYAVLGYPTTLWMVALWINLSTTLRHSLYWLNNHYVLISLFGGTGGMAAYYAGHNLGAIVLTEPLIISSLFVFSAWLVALPLLYIFINRLDGALVKRQTNG